MKRICRVCELVDKDRTKKYVTFCNTCDAFICTKCKPNLIRRGQAFILQQIENI